jgi:CBS domain-containing protein
MLRRYGDRARGVLETIEGGVDSGRQTMADLIDRSQAVVGDWLPRRSRPFEPYLWFGAGVLAAAIAALLGRRAGRLALSQGSRVNDVMIEEVETIDASATLTDAAQKMRDANVGVLPVLEAGKVRGIVTDRDLVVRGMARGIEPSSIRVGDCATSEPIAARPDWSVDEALSAMAKHQIGRLPVVDESGRVLGIVTLSSLALRSRKEEGALDTAKQVSLRSARAS